MTQSPKGLGNRSPLHGAAASYILESMLSIVLATMVPVLAGTLPPPMIPGPNAAN